AAVVQSLLRTLAAGGQRLYGFPGLLRDGGRARLMVPFKPQDGNGTFTAPGDWDVREGQGGRLLHVFPPAGSFEERVAAGEGLLTAALRARGLTATGPIIAQPSLHLEDGTPPAAKLSSPVVRVSVSVQ